MDGYPTFSPHRRRLPNRRRAERQELVAGAVILMATVGFDAVGRPAEVLLSARGTVAVWPDPRGRLGRDLRSSTVRPLGSGAGTKHRLASGDAASAALSRSSHWRATRSIRDRRDAGSDRRKQGRRAVTGNLAIPPSSHLGGRTCGPLSRAAGAGALAAAARAILKVDPLGERDGKLLPCPEFTPMVTVTAPSVMAAP
jgi:hypothetical protein